MGGAGGFREPGVLVSTRTLCAQRVITTATTIITTTITTTTMPPPPPPPHERHHSTPQVTGGKWTTYRRMAQDVVDTLVTSGRLPAGARPCATRSLKLLGAREYHSTTHAEVGAFFCGVGWGPRKGFTRPIRWQGLLVCVHVAGRMACCAPSILLAAASSALVLSGSRISIGTGRWARNCAHKTHSTNRTESPPRTHSVSKHMCTHNFTHRMHAPLTTHKHAHSSLSSPPTPPHPTPPSPQVTQRSIRATAAFSTPSRTPSPDQARHLAAAYGDRAFSHHIWHTHPHSTTATHTLLSIMHLVPTLPPTPCFPSRPQVAQRGSDIAAAIALSAPQPHVITSDQARHLAAAYGDRAFDVLELIKWSGGALAAPLALGLPYIEAEVVHCCRQVGGLCGGVRCGGGF